MMKGIQYIIDGKNKRRAVVIDLKQHGELWEDFMDVLVAQSRAK